MQCILLLGFDFHCNLENVQISIWGRIFIGAVLVPIQTWRLECDKALPIRGRLAGLATFGAALGWGAEGNRRSLQGFLHYNAPRIFGRHIGRS